ncbi:MAG: hypothetical protein V7K98_01230 [Nostoc sp.]|uniref:hypothetical protein n=1 Tax=Nostoc sp. TaxID=1180 RepID=UPI002FF9B572
MGIGAWGIGHREEARVVFPSTHCTLLLFSVANAQCPMPNAQCPMPNAQFPMPNAQFPMPNAP